MRAGLERQVRHEGGEARRARAQAMGKSKSALFHENKKRWLGKTLGKITRHMSIAHCWEVGADGIRVLQTSPAKVKASLDKHFYKWTRHTTDRDDTVLEGYTELTDTYQEFKEEALWHMPTEQVPEGDPEFLTRPPGDEECLRAAKKMGSSKGAGPSGHSIETLMNGPEWLQQAWWCVVRKVFEAGELPEEFKDGDIYCLPKTSEAITSVTNVRPITLLEHIKMKLITRVIMMRIDEVMMVNKSKLLRGEQFAGTKGGSTGDPLAVRLGVVEHCKAEGKELHIFDSDMSKAFDSVHFWSLDQALVRLGMPEKARKLIMSVQGGRSRVITNGTVTEGYQVEKGVRQGEVLSPFLWVAFIDGLLAAQAKVGKGVVVGTNEQHKASVLGTVYMDDAVWYSETEAEMRRRVEVHSRWCQYHGVKLNLDKSTYTHVPARGCRSKGQPAPPKIEGVAAKVGHLEGYFKYLGIYMSPLGSVKHEVGRLNKEIFDVYDAIERQRMTVEEARYVINTVIAGKL